MPYKLIKGRFHIHYPDIPLNGPEPDGDTLKFEPFQRALVEALPGGRSPKFNGRGFVNIRFESMDTLETHYEDMHQKLEVAIAQRDAMLTLAGFETEKIKYFDRPGAKFKVESMGNQPHPIPGHILANALDPFGRVIAFVYQGDEREEIDGAEVWVEPADILPSINAQMLADGLTYPAFYSSLPPDLRESLKGLTHAAREGTKGLWADRHDRPGQLIEIDNLNTLQELIIWPKLFRRLARFFAAGNEDLRTFDAWLRSDPRDNDDTLLLPTLEIGNMHDIVETTDATHIKIKYEPEDLVIVPDSTVPVERPTDQPIRDVSVRIIAALVNPSGGGETGRETVTLLNVSPDDVDLTGWQLADKIDRRDTLNMMLKAGDSTRIMLKTGRLSNEQGTITLFDAKDNQVHQVSYTKKDAERQGWSIAFA